MKIYEYTPPKNTRSVTPLVIVLAVAGGVLFLLPSLISDMPMRGLSQMLGIILITAMVFLISRYSGLSFVYAIVENGERTVDLTVTEIERNGKKQTTVCRVALSSITEAYLLYPERAGESEKVKKLMKRARGEQRKLFIYTQGMRPTPVCILFLEECGEPLLIKLSADERLFSYFEQYAQK